MVKEILKEKEPTAYLSLYNDLKTGHLSHSYLFTGELNPLKTETAILLAQSIIEGNNDFACEECNTCRRIKEGKYYDVIYLNGYDRTIKKDDIENIFKEFNRTSLEKAGKKVYIISNINNASTKVLNMILKFMEEPSNENTFGIFTSDNIDALLTTVVSRCKKVPFLTRDYSEVINRYLENGFENDDAYLLANILHTYDKEFDLNDPIYQTAKDFVYQTIDYLKTPDEIPVMYFRDFYSSVDKDDFSTLARYYLDIMNIMLEDGISGHYLDNSQYDSYINKLLEVDITRLLEVFIEARNKYTSNIEKKLMFDQIAYKIISYIK